MAISMMTEGEYDTRGALTAHEVAKITRKSIKTVYRWLEKGQLKGYRPGGHGHWLVLRDDLEAFCTASNRMCDCTYYPANDASRQANSENYSTLEGEAEP